MKTERNLITKRQSIAEADAYINAMNTLTGQEYDKQTAKQLWDDIHEHWLHLNAYLNREVSFYVAALDYFDLKADKIEQYIFVEQNRFNRLLELSTLDGMTQLYNHRTFVMLLECQVDFCRRKKHPLCLLMADIDNFKSINDSNGHLHGDGVLVKIAQLLTQSLRSMDIAGRYGGEEFAIIFPETTLDDARDIAERIRQLIEHAFQGKAPISMGLADFPRCGNNATALFQAADQSLYRAKTSGKNQLQCF